ncbi:MAG: hypothetical protein IJH86_00760 [Clostridia bacterium]|nr:hypothetical protein [Clostridia bacterium]
MPDTRLTWYNLREHLRKFCLIYAVIIAVALVLGNLLWIATEPRVPENERILIYMADEWSNPEPLDAVAADVLKKLQSEDDTLREVAFESLMFADPAREYTGVMVLMTRLAVGEGDIFLANENAMEALVNAGACLPLDDHWAAGWLNDGGLEPYYATVTDQETGESATLLAGLRLDSLTALRQMEAFDNEGAFLVIAANGENIEASLRAAEYLVEDLKKEAAQ